MPAISALPDTLSAFTGAELIALVQDGETRQAPLHAALDAITPSLSNARWIQRDDVAGLINAPTIIRELNGYHMPQRVQFTAKVDARRRSSDTLLWHTAFQKRYREYGESESYVLTATDISNGLNGFNEGGYQIGILDSTADPFQPILLYETDQDGVRIGLVHTFTGTALANYYHFTVPLGQRRTFEFEQPGYMATVEARQTGEYVNNGNPPVFTPSGDTLQVKYEDGYQPNDGLITVRAQLYDATGTLIASSSDVTLTLSTTYPQQEA